MPIALVTGASRGFGYQLAVQLAARDWDLVLDARNTPALKWAADRLEGRGRVVAVDGDVSHPAHRMELATSVRRFGRLDLLVNNASTLGPAPLPALDRYPIDELQRTLEINAVAPLALIQAVLPELTSAAGTIVNLSSDAAVEAYPGWGGYGSSKAALDHITAVLAVEQPGLRVYSFDPGDMRTAMQQQAFPEEDISDRSDPKEVVPALLRLVDERPPSGRYRRDDLPLVSETRA